MTAPMRRVAVAAIFVGAIVACSPSSSSDLAKAALGDGCVINSDCASPFVCAFRLCHVQCVDSRDCPSGARCMTSDRPSNVCQLEKEKRCTTNAQCPEGKTCALDNECRDKCAAARDCIPGQQCVSSSCVEPTELVNGKLPNSQAVDGGVSVPGQPCVYNSDCESPLVCLNSFCATECFKAVDCALGQLCVANKCTLPGPTGSTTDASVMADASTDGGRNPDPPAGRVGCFLDDPVRDLGLLLGSASAATNGACATTCENLGYPFSSVQFGLDCSCGVSYGRYGAAEASACNRIPCTGDATQPCGGWFVAVVTRTNKPLLNPQSRGCFVENPLSPDYYSPDPNNKSSQYQFGESNSPRMCATYCKSSGFPYSALQDGGWCYCGSLAPKLATAPASECNRVCGADKSSFCGGNLRNSVYFTP